MPAAMGQAVCGGGFLVEDAADIFTPEDFTEEHRAIARTTSEFFTRDVEPRVEAILEHEPGAAIAVLRKSAELGLTAVMVPEQTAAWRWT